MDIAGNSFVFIFGVVIGSFLNVCIHRLPQGQSVVSPGSRCPKCEKPIAWYDNIPLFSYLILRGKCRACSARISFRYFLIELANGLLWLMLWFFYGRTPLFFTGIVLFSILLAICVTDFETGLIPDKLTFPGMIAGLAFSAFCPELHGETLWYRGLGASFLGLLGGGAILFGVGLLGNAIFKKESMGGGDIKLLAMLGAFLGLKEVFYVFTFSPLAALPFALYMKIFRKAETIPYGPFLAVTGACFFIFGEKIESFIFSTYGV